MRAGEVERILRRNRVDYEDRDIEYATQFRCDSGEIINVYDSGKVVFQGERDTDLVREIAEEGGLTLPDEVEAAAPPDDPARGDGGDPEDNVFIVYGHDHDVRDQLELLLRRLGLNPIILENLPARGDTIIEKLERYLGEHGQVGFACVLLTPDDEGFPAGQEEERQYRARQNVILELGMVLAQLGRERVAILHKQSVELPSDIGGLSLHPF